MDYFAYWARENAKKQKTPASIATSRLRHQTEGGSLPLGRLWARQPAGIPLLREHGHEDGQPEEGRHARGRVARQAGGRPLLRAQARHAALQQRDALLQLAHRPRLRGGLAQRSLARRRGVWRGRGLLVGGAGEAAVQGAAAAGAGAAGARQVQGEASAGKQRAHERTSARSELYRCTRRSAG